MEDFATKEFSVELILSAIKQPEVGGPVFELIRKVGSGSRRFDGCSNRAGGRMWCYKRPQTY